MVEKAEVKEVETIVASEVEKAETEVVRGVEPRMVAAKAGGVL